MLGLLNSHVDPPNSPLGVAHCLLSEGQWIRTPCTRGTQLTGHSSGAPHSCQPTVPARFIIVSEFCISGLWGQELILTFWVTSCFTKWKFQPDPSIFMDWFKFWHCTWVSYKILGQTAIPYSNLTRLWVLEERGEVLLRCPVPPRVAFCLKSSRLFPAGEQIDSIVPRLTCSGGVAG